LNRVTQKAARIIFFTSAAASALAAALVFGFLFMFGFPLIGGGEFLSLLTRPWAPGQGMYGFLPMITGTAAISFLSIVFAFPLSLGTVCFMGGLGPEWMSRFLDGFVRFMTGIPTVIYGFLGVFLLVPVVRNLFVSAGSGMCILSASLMLSLLVCPTMIIFFKEGVDSVDFRYSQAADALDVENLTFSYHKQPVFENITLDFEAHAITAITGPSGRGKSTFLSILNRLWESQPFATMQGKVWIRLDGQWTDIYGKALGKPDLRRKVGMVFQTPNPLP